MTIQLNNIFLPDTLFDSARQSGRTTRLMTRLTQFACSDRSCLVLVPNPKRGKILQDLFQKSNPDLPAYVISLVQFLTHEEAKKLVLEADRRKERGLIYEHYALLSDPSDMEYDISFKESLKTYRQFDDPVSFLEHQKIAGLLDALKVWKAEYDRPTGFLDEARANAHKGLLSAYNNIADDYHRIVKLLDDKANENTKGALGGLCNRRACMERGANWYNSSTRKHYCQRCAFDINSFKPNWIDGKPLCNKVTKEGEVDG